MLSIQLPLESSHSKTGCRVLQSLWSMSIPSEHITPSTGAGVKALVFKRRNGGPSREAAEPGADCYGPDSPSA